MRYKSSTLAEINRLIATLNQSGHFPYNISNEIADKHGLNVNLVRNALKGLPANINILRSTVEEAEKLAKLKPPKVPKRKVRGYSIPELYTKSFLPAKYCELTAEIAGLKPNAVAYFIKNQLEGRSAYASSAGTVEALYQVAEMNEEWELHYRLEKVLEKIKKKE